MRQANVNGQRPVGRCGFTYPRPRWFTLSLPGLAGVSWILGASPAIAQTHTAAAIATSPAVTYYIAEQWDLTAIALPAIAAAPMDTLAMAPLTAVDLDLPPTVIESSPVLRRWLETIPDVRSEIRHDPSFATRIHLGYSQSPGGAANPGLNLGLEDWFLGNSGFTLSADYTLPLAGDRASWGTDLRYYLRPLGRYVNIAPTVGYRAIATDDDRITGETLGIHVILALSRTGAADLTFTQHWLNPGTDAEAGLTTVTAGYALTPQLRLATTLSRQNSRQGHDSRVGLGLEWQL